MIGEAIMVQISKDKLSASTNVSIYLSITSVSSIASQYLGGYLLTFWSVKQLFLVTSILPALNLIAALLCFEKKIEYVVGTC